MTYFPKEIAEQLHARQRARERFGFDLTEGDCLAIRDKIRTPDQPPQFAVHLQRQSKRRSVWAVWHSAEWLPVVYCNRRGTIVTFLPKRALNPHREKLPW